jgi:ATP-dependent RNA helicase SUPV3L1/SUV3
VKPAGALDGTGFTVTVGMTSLVGSSGEDFASILRALGYRMERRPKPLEPVAETAAPAEAAAAIAEPAAQTDPVAESESQPGESTPVSAAQEMVDSHSLLPDIYFGPAPDETPVADAPSVVAEAPVVIDEAATDETPAAKIEIATAEAAPSDATQPVAASGEPEMIEVWRPGRFEGGRERHRQGRSQRQHGRHGRDQSTATAEANGSTQPANASAPEAHAPRGDKRPHRGHRPHRGDRPEGQRPQHHGKRGRHDERRERHERPERRERPERQPDPNSPFAKLAALKAQLESGGKEKS